MLVREAKLKHGTPNQYQALDEAIRTGQFVRNKCLRLWMDTEKCNRAKMQALCKRCDTKSHLGSGQPHNEMALASVQASLRPVPRHQ
jgi:hypothetical protein